MKFTVYGNPKGKGRPRFTRTGRAYTPADTKVAEAEVANAYREAGCRKIDGAVVMFITMYYKIPKSATKKDRALMESGEMLPTIKPDADNVIKLIGDSLNGIAYDDDKQIVTVIAEKKYGDPARVTVELISYADWIQSWVL